MHSRIEFITQIAQRNYGKITHAVVWLPEKFHGTLPLLENPRLRVDATIADQVLDAALQPAGGRWFILLSRGVLKAAGVTVGDKVRVSLKVVENQSRVILPEDLELALLADSKFRRDWEKLTPGRRRGLAHWIKSAKTQETRFQRLEELVLIVEGREEERSRLREMRRGGSD